MFFKNKSNRIKCESCNSKIDKNFSFCPYCGNSMLNQEDEIRDFGLLGRKDAIDETSIAPPFMPGNFGLTDKIIGSLVNSLVKSLDKQFKELEKTEVKSFPNGIRIHVNSSPQKMKKTLEKTNINAGITDEQLKRMASLPRATAKASVKRLSDKVVYELNMPGVDSPEDVFVSKLESGYEVKAIGEKKVYTKSLPISLPLRRFILDKNKLFVEFKLEEEQ